MPEGLDTLTTKEKETLRLLVAGHDAKSIAMEFDLSVHTINDRLRDARRKLGVTSSREAARILASAENTSPKYLGDNKIGVSNTKTEVHQIEESQQGKRPGFNLIWLGGGILMLSLVLAAVVFMSNDKTSSNSGNPEITATSDTSEAASNGAAMEWLALVDDQNWSESWRRAGSFFRSSVSEEAWSSSASSLRNPLGALKSRAVLKVTKATSLPGAPDGEYELIEFQSNFENKRMAIETLVLQKEGETWKAVGYFIR